jgi:hypothetical protein
VEVAVVVAHKVVLEALRQAVVVLALHLKERLEHPTRAVAVVVDIQLGLEAVALVLSFFLFQHLVTQAQPQAHRQSQQAVQTQF